MPFLRGWTVKAILAMQGSQRSRGADLSFCFREWGERLVAIAHQIDSRTRTKQLRRRCRPIAKEMQTAVKMKSRIPVAVLEASEFDVRLEGGQQVEKLHRPFAKLGKTLVNWGINLLL